MRSDTLSATLPDLSARIMRDALVKDHRIRWESFCNQYRISSLPLESGANQLLAEEELQLQRAFCEATGQGSNLWFDMGLRYRSMRYGNFGLAMMTARTLGEGLDIACKYQELTYSLISYRLKRQGNGAMALIGDSVHLPPAMREFSQYRDLGAIRTLIADLTGGSLPLERILVAAPVPPDWESLRNLFPCPLQFDAERTEWRFAAGTASMALPLADGELLTLYSSKCEQMLKSARSNMPVSLRLEAMLDNMVERPPNAREIAQSMALSERTLHRRLADEGTRFSELVDRARYRRACELLADRALSVENIAAATGFAETSSFSRAFKRWSGMGSLEYRRQLKDGSPEN